MASSCVSCHGFAARELSALMTNGSGDTMSEVIELGTKRIIDGRLRIYCGGYWIKVYEAPADTLEQKKQLIEALTRRLFNHVEHGINMPGRRLDEARRAYDHEQDPERRRVKGAMLAGALFNRATAIFTKVVELQELGVKIRLDNSLLRECGDLLQEAFDLGKLVLHRSGEEGIDELWGEPLKAFSFPVNEFYKSRYIKISQTMAAIDRIGEGLATSFHGHAMFAGVGPLIEEFASVAKLKCETLRTDPEIFEVWPSFVVAGERLEAFRPALPRDPDPGLARMGAEAVQLLQEGKNLVVSITRARVPMPKTEARLLDRCQRFATVYVHRTPPARTEPPFESARMIHEGGR